MHKNTKVLTLLAASVLFVGALNLIRVDVHVQAAAKFRDFMSPRAYYRYGIDPNSIVFDLWGLTTEASGAGVIGGFFQFAEEMKDRDFSSVYLAYHGSIRFRLSGEDFKEIGQSFAWQNPVYLIRMLPEKLQTPNGERAFDSWSGGMLGVLNAQITDVNDFTRQWWMKDEIERH